MSKIVVVVTGATGPTGSGGGGSSALDDMTDVTITAAASGDILRHNGSAWVDAVGTTFFEVAGAAAAAQAASQPLDSDLTAIAALTTTAYGRAFLALANQAATMALLSAASDTASGIVELATTAETTTGTDIVRAVTPAGLLNATTASNINARTAVKKAGSLIGTRRGINFIEGTNVTITTADDSGNEEVDVTIAASGGGSSIGAGQSFQVAAGYVPASIFTDVGALTNNTLNANEVHFIPLILDANATADRIGISVHTAAAASEVARLAIYNTANGRPTTVLLDAGTVAVDTTGVKEITISQALTAGTLYALAVHFKVITQLHCFSGQSTTDSVFGFQTCSTRATGATYGSGLPASPTITTNSGKNPPIIRVRLT